MSFGPRRREAEATLGLRVAGIELALHAPAGAIEALRPQWQGFVTDASLSRGSATWSARARQIPGEPNPATLLTPPEARDDGAALCIEQGDLFALRIASGSGSIDIEYRRAPYDDRRSTGPAGLSGALTALWSVLTIETDGLLLHASGVRTDVGAVAFFGPSGAGKSTTAAAWDPDDVLNDELVAMTYRGGEPRLHATPFSGTLDAPRRDQSAPLRLLARLAKAPEARCTPLSPSDGFPALARCAALVGGVPTLEARAFETLASVAARVPLCQLDLTLDGETTRATVARALSSGL